MGRKRKTPKLTQVRHPDRPASGTRQQRRTLSLKQLLPDDPAWDWPVVSVKRPGDGGMCDMLDLKRCHEFRLKFAFHAANEHIQRLGGHTRTIKKRTKRHFDDQMAELICEAAELHLGELEEDFSLLETEHLVFWARIEERLHGYGTNSFALHGLITPHILVEFFKLILDSFKGYAGSSYVYPYTLSTHSMDKVASILSESESHEYDGPDPNVVYGEREKRVVTADGRDLELDGPGTDMTGDMCIGRGRCRHKGVQE